MSNPNGGAASLAPLRELLAAARDADRATPLRVGDRRALHRHSYLLPALAPLTEEQRARCEGIVQAVVSEFVPADRAAGALLGLVLGDAFGHPFEFLAVDSRMDPPGEAGGRRSWLFTDALYPPTPARRDRDGTSSETADGGKTALRYVGEYNRFGLQRGQWTDDASMALCLADSLCHCGRYEGADCRVRFYCWWTRGYNNAFRFSATKRDSVGLGGNIAASLGELEETYMGRAATEGVPPEVSSTGEDAGNGAMMRLAPIALRYAGNPTDAMRYAAASSRATHPGADSEACCAFMAYFMATAIARPQYDSTPLSAFLDRCIAAFPSAFRAALPELAASAGGQKVQRLLRCDPPSACEELWRWREPRLLIEESITARGRRYNGHPVLPDYFGAYSMDGLAMALWGMHGADSFAKAIGRVINLLGDADSTGAIAGQMAGAFYGASTMHDDPVAAAMIQHVRRWDPFMEIELRALMLVEPSGLLATPVPASQE